MAGEPCRAFVPKPLPPEPPLTLDADLLKLLNEGMEPLE
jgi:hypothetical protein